MSNSLSGAPVLTAHGHTLDLTALRTSLCSWDKQNRRAFPWRETADPFHVLMAELMLRRTQALQVAPVYRAFLEAFPDPIDLALATEEEVAQVLFPLGLSWRVAAFQQIARILVDQYHGQVPDHYDVLLSLPGVGDYVASAVCCFAYGQARCIIDTNTVRIVGRIFHFTTHAESRRRKPVRDLLTVMVDPLNPRTYNFAMLDLAARVCTPENPKCFSCPLLAECATGQERTSHV